VAECNQSAVLVKPHPDGLCWACGEGDQGHRVQFIDGRAYILCEAVNYSWHSDMRSRMSEAERTSKQQFHDWDYGRLGNCRDCGAPFADNKPCPGYAVRIPTSEAEAELMVKLGEQWLHQNAPHRLKTNVAPSPGEVLSADLPMRIPSDANSPATSYGADLPKLEYSEHCGCCQRNKITVEVFATPEKVNRE
jgi:hypothetical protein